MKKLMTDWLILFILPLTTSIFFQINLKLVIMYTGFIIFFIITTIIRSLKMKKYGKIRNWPYRISNRNIFNNCCYFLLINYYGENLPEFFLGGDKIYHIIYSEPIKSIIYSIMAAIVFTWYTEYREYSRNYYLFCYLKNHIRELWTLFYNIEYQEYAIYLDITKEKIEELLLGQKKEELTKDLLEDIDLLKIKKCIEEINKILFSMYTPVNQSIYYLLQNIDRIIYKYNYTKTSNYNYSLEDLTIEISKEVKEILIELDAFEKQPLATIIM